jgi:hypothetical protein
MWGRRRSTGGYSVVGASVAADALPVPPGCKRLPSLVCDTFATDLQHPPPTITQRVGRWRVRAGKGPMAAAGCACLVILLEGIG